jgi:hypothetical protein
VVGLAGVLDPAVVRPGGRRGADLIGVLGRPGVVRAWRAWSASAILALGVAGALAVVEELRQLGGLGRHLPAC